MSRARAPEQLASEQEPAASLPVAWLINCSPLGLVRMYASKEEIKPLNFNRFENPSIEAGM